MSARDPVQGLRPRAAGCQLNFGRGKMAFSEANWFGQTTSMSVREARDGDPVVQGSILVAPGGRHTTVVRNGAHYQIRIEDSGPVQHHRPSVDVLFQSAAKCAGANAMGMLLTGMGSDGARGLGALRMAGARTVAQDEASSVVWGMPRVAIEMGAAEAVLGLERMSEAALKWWRSGRIDESRASA